MYVSSPGSIFSWLPLTYDTDTAWERIPVSSLAKKVIWRLESDRYALTSDIMYDLGSQLPNYYEGPDPNAMDYRVTERLRGAAWEKFLALDMFFVKVSRNRKSLRYTRSSNRPQFRFPT